MTTATSSVASASAEGLTEQDCREIADLLYQALADTYTLYVKAQNYHWNVTGQLFQPLHALFEQQYEELHDASDVLAERIRALGAPAHATLRAFAARAHISESDTLPDSMGMVRDLAEGHAHAITCMRQVMHRAEQSDDQVTMDIMIDRLRAHSKSAWILRSHLG